MHQIVAGVKRSSTHVTNNKNVISTYANDPAESLCIARMAPSLSCFLDSLET